MTLLRSLNCDGRYGMALGLCAAALLLPLAGGNALRMWGRYERAGVLAGQWWRLVTAHLVHLDVSHAVLNTAGLVLLWALFARTYRAWQWLVTLGITLVCIDAGFLLLSPQLEWYVGASALLHGVFACGCLAMIRQGDRIGVIAAVVFAGKLALEHWHGPLPFEPAGLVVTVSHLYGAIGGVIAGVILQPRRDPVY
jgi:rhomboid family GlyGly-CTERM serine protease